MPSLEIIESDRFGLMEQVAKLRMEGKKETAIAKETGLKRAQVIELFNEWKDMVASDGVARDMARDFLNQTIIHYDSIIEQYYALLGELEGLNFHHLVAAQKNSALKAIADLEAKRVELLQKAGLFDSQELAADLAERERREEILLGILRNDLCPDCKRKVAQKLQTITQQVEIIEVVPD